MNKVIAISVVVLLFAGGAFAAVGDIIQGQEWALGLNSLVQFNQGAGSATTDQTVNLFDGQNAGNVGLGTSGAQIAMGHLTQTGTVAGDCINGSVDQQVGLDASAASGYGQGQNITQCCGPMVQSQGVGMLGKQVLTKSAGPGSVDGTNGVCTMMGQNGENISSGMDSISSLCGTQTSQVAGDACSAGSVQTEMVAGTSQSQQVN